MVQLSLPPTDTLAKITDMEPKDAIRELVNRQIAMQRELEHMFENLDEENFSEYMQINASRIDITGEVRFLTDGDTAYVTSEDLEGYITAEDVGASGATVIHGDRISSGTISSSIFETESDANDDGVRITGGYIKIYDLTNESTSYGYIDWEVENNKMRISSSTTLYLGSATGTQVFSVNEVDIRAGENYDVDIYTSGTGWLDIDVPNVDIYATVGDVNITATDDVYINAGDGEHIYIGRAGESTQIIDIGEAGTTVNLNGTVKVNGTTIS